MAVFVLLFAVIGLQGSAGVASAHEEGEPPNGGRLPLQPDFQRNGDTTFRFLPGKEEYEIKQRGRPASFAHADPAPNDASRAEAGIFAQQGGQMKMPAGLEDDPVCRTSGARIVPVYTHRPGTEGLNPSRIAFFRQMIKRMNWKFVQQTSSTPRTVQLKVDCNANGEINVFDAVTPSRTFASIKSNMPGQVYGEGEVGPLKYLAFDSEQEEGISGLGERKNDTEKTVWNYNNTMTLVAVIYACCHEKYSTVHELLHTFGASQGQAIPSPPYASVGNHCTDGVDILCYNDGTGSDHGFYNEERCPVAPEDGINNPIDCGRDTYFDTSNPTTGWLSTHWNSGGAENQFLWAPPKAETRRAAEVTGSSIKMAAMVNGEGEGGGYYFEYGNTPYYGHQTEEAGLSFESFGPREVTIPLEELPVGWTIHYRVVFETYGGGIATGQDQVATTAWAPETSVGPAEAKSDWLNDVSCAAGGVCVAVGAATDKAGSTVPASQKLSGGAWTLANPPAPGGLQSELKGVSCVSATSCMTVGYAESKPFRPLAMVWNGSGWAETSPAPAGPAGYRSYFNDVSCVAANSCEAVGYSAPTSGAEIIKPLVSHWNGSTWTIKTSANPNTAGGEPGQEDNILESVSCSSATVCMAVGLHYSSVGGVQAYQPLTERLSGEEWVSESADTAYIKSKGETDAWLYGVSCPTTVCFAVGSSAAGHGAGSTKIPFTQHWNGSKWNAVSAPNETNGPTELYGVSCSSPTACRAVGAGGRGLHWMGLYWKTEAPQAPADTDYSQPPRLRAVSCPTSAECHAVGSYRNLSGYTGRLIESWSGAGVKPRTSLAYATNFTETSALLRGYVDPGGVDTNYYFEYGPTEAYGTKTPVASAGSWAVGLSSGWFEGTATASGLEPGTKYHYRVVADNGFFTANGPDYTFETKGNLVPLLAEMPVTEAFSGGTSVISDFATKWSGLQWVGGAAKKGKNNVGGWGPTEAAANGAYFAPNLTDTGAGVATVATMAANPGATGRFSLWLDMPAPATAKTGYELRFQATAANVYTVSLKKWTAGVEATLATKAGYSFPNGASLALVDKGGTVMAWTNFGGGFAKILSASDTAFSSGSAGVEALGISARLTKFKAGSLLEKAASADAALKVMTVTDSLSRSEVPLSLGSSWAALSWDTGAAGFKTGFVEANGWGPLEAPPVVNGAYWQKASVGDTGTGAATIATFSVPYLGAGGRYFSLWLNAPSPGTAKSGYELKLTEPSFGSFELKLTKWVNGAATALASKSGLAYATGSKFALVDKGGVIAAWSATSSSAFTPIISASDSTYSYGYGGIEGSGSPRLRDFKLGQLALY
jgi:hypothetical protein